MNQPKKKSGCLLPLLIVVGLIWILSGGEDTPEPDPIPQSTTPVVTTQAAPVETYPNVPDYLQEHIALDWRGQGSCEYMRGDIVATAILVSDGESTWNSWDIEKVKQEHALAASRLAADAAAYGTYLNIRIEYRQVAVQEILTVGNGNPWVDPVLNAAGLPGAAAAGLYLEDLYGVEGAPVFFCLNKTGRSFAHPVYGDGLEYGIFFEDLGDFRHELIHIYGGRDYYFPDGYKVAAQPLFPNSIMLESGENKMVDSFSAYMIGWTDWLSPEGLSFLQQTSHITDADMSASYEEETFTGYRTKPVQGGVYTGEWYKGALQGYGTMVYDDGGVYEGQWNYGAFDGQGTMRYANGSVCTGTWVRGVQHGYCTFWWPDGTKYEGQWENGAITGYGTMTWPNGVVYTGNWKNGEFIG